MTGPGREALAHGTAEIEAAAAGELGELEAAAVAADVGWAQVLFTTACFIRWVIA